MVEMWMSDHCPKCRSRNFVCNGDPSDMTVMDVTGIQCWGCGHQWSLDEDSDEHCYFERGRHFEEVRQDGDKGVAG